MTQCQLSIQIRVRRRPTYHLVVALVLLHAGFLHYVLRRREPFVPGPRLTALLAGLMWRVEAVGPRPAWFGHRGRIHRAWLRSRLCRWLDNRHVDAQIAALDRIIKDPTASWAARSYCLDQWVQILRAERRHAIMGHLVK
jgi:hypothetical protein